MRYNMIMKFCKICGEEKPYNPAVPGCKSPKRRGFHGDVCWDCYKVSQTARYQEATKQAREIRQEARKARQQAQEAQTEAYRKAMQEAREIKKQAQEARRLARETVAQVPKTKCTLATLAWKKKYPERNAASRMRYHTAQIQRLPAWADLTAIKQVYAEAQKQGLVVDHIYPLRGELVSGLHVANNLQLLTKSKNSSKGNRLLPEHQA
jgi:hypothetical protein